MKKIILSAVSAELSRDLLKEVPHRMVCKGMAVVYHYVENGKITDVITNDMALEFGFTEAQLFEMAQRNLKHFLPVLKEEEEGVYTITSLNNEKVGSGMAFINGIMDRVLNKTGAGQVYVTLEPEKVTICTKISSLFRKTLEQAKECTRIGRVMSYSKEGFATI